MSQPLTLERFEQYEQKAEARHRELMTAVADVVTHVNDHFDECLEHLERLLTLDARVELIERRTKKLAELAGHPELATANF